MMACRSCRIGKPPLKALVFEEAGDDGAERPSFAVGGTLDFVDLPSAGAFAALFSIINPPPPSPLPLAARV
jgi:hypothetical protein